MLRYAASRFASLFSVTETTSKILRSKRSYGKNVDEARIERMFNDQQATYYTAKDVEFCPNRAKEIMQNNVEETSKKAVRDEPYVSELKDDPPSAICEEEHKEAYQAHNSVSLYSVMQSNVPEPFNTRDKSPTHLNMPGSSDTRDCKYLSGKMQTAHHSRQ